MEHSRGTQLHAQRAQKSDLVMSRPSQAIQQRSQKSDDDPRLRLPLRGPVQCFCQSKPLLSRPSQDSIRKCRNNESDETSEFDNSLQFKDDLGILHMTYDSMAEFEFERRCTPIMSPQASEKIFGKEVSRSSAQLNSFEQSIPQGLNVQDTLEAEFGKAPLPMIQERTEDTSAALSINGSHTTDKPTISNNDSLPRSASMPLVDDNPMRRRKGSTLSVPRRSLAATSQTSIRPSTNSKATSSHKTFQQHSSSKQKSSSLLPSASSETTGFAEDLLQHSPSIAEAVVFAEVFVQHSPSVAALKSAPPSTISEFTVLPEDVLQHSQSIASQSFRSSTSSDARSDYLLQYSPPSSATSKSFRFSVSSEAPFAEVWL